MEDKDEIWVVWKERDRGDKALASGVRDRRGILRGKSVRCGRIADVRCNKVDVEEEVRCRASAMSAARHTVRYERI